MENILSVGAAMLQQLKTSCQRNDMANSNDLLKKLKLLLTQFRLFPPFPENDGTLKQRLSLAREVYEIGAFIQLRLEDAPSFERHVSQLKPFYSDFSSLLDPSASQSEIIGLYLMRLLSTNRIADFHTELTALPATLQDNPFVRFPIQLERDWMAGKFNRVLACSQSAPSKFYLVFLDLLLQTIRNQEADCFEKSYETLPLADVQSMLTLDESKLQELVEQRKWTVAEGVVHFAEPREKTFDIPAHRVISEQLLYATELERII